MEALELVGRVLLALLACVVVVQVALSAIRTFVLPRGVNSRVTAVVFVALRRTFDWRVRRLSTYERRDAAMALFAPLALFSLPGVWLITVLAAFAVIFWALEPGEGVVAAIEASGSNLFTLGIKATPSFPGKLIGFVEAGLGLALLALLLTYLPTIYGAFSKREAAVQMLEVRAGTPPSAVVMLARYTSIGGLDRLDGLWQEWERWFVEVEESHQTLAALAFLRSPRPELSWVTAAGCVLDSAAITASCLDLPGTAPDARLCIRGGYLCLRRLCEFFGQPYDDDPAPTDPIAVTKEELFDTLDQLEAAGVPVKHDREQCWRDFAGWRVNYDTPLLELAALVMAPVAPWSSDRSPLFQARFRRRRD